MAVTSPDNLWSPDSTDPYNLTPDLAAMQDTVQDGLVAVRSQAGTGRGTNTERDSSSPVTGSRWVSTTDGYLYRYNGSTWVLAPGEVIAVVTRPSGTQGSFTNSTTEVTGTTVNISMPVAGTVELSGVLNTFSTDTPDVFQIIIRDNTTNLRVLTVRANSSTTAANTSRAQTLNARFDLTAGAHRINLAMLRVVGSGTGSVSGDATNVNYYTLKAG